MRSPGVWYTAGARELLESGQAPRMLREADEYARTFDRAPVHLVIRVVLEALAIVDSALERPSIVGGASIYPFVQNVLLGLRAEGLGAAFTTLLTPAEDEVRARLGIPEGVALAGHISVGYRADAWPRALTRSRVEEFAYAEHWGERWHQGRS
jgi:nitroreductase